MLVWNNAFIILKLLHEFVKALFYSIAQNRAYTHTVFFNSINEHYSANSVFSRRNLKYRKDTWTHTVNWKKMSKLSFKIEMLSCRPFWTETWHKNIIAHKETKWFSFTHMLPSFSINEGSFAALWMVENNNLWKQAT